MNYTLQLQAEAVLDIREAFAWYEAQRPGLGDELLEELESSFGKLVSHPLHYIAINQRFRRLKVHRFPYLVIYEVEGDRVIVNSVHHTRQKPIG